MPVYEYHAILQEREKKRVTKWEFDKCALICTRDVCVAVGCKNYCLWWKWFKSGATKLSSVSVLYVHVSVVWIWCVVCVCSNFMEVLLMPEHSLSPSQTLETAWPVTRRFTRLWLKRWIRKERQSFRENTRYSVPFNTQTKEFATMYSSVKRI